MRKPQPGPEDAGAQNRDAQRHREPNHCAIEESKEEGKPAKQHLNGFTGVQQAKKARRAPSLSYFETDSDDSYGLLEDFSRDEDYISDEEDEKEWPASRRSKRGDKLIDELSAAELEKLLGDA